MEKTTDSKLPDVITPLAHGAAFLPKLSKLQQAFGLAMRNSEYAKTGKGARKEFRRVADLIWQACGGSK